MRRSYKAFDEEDGIEVAWNQVKLRNVEEREKNALMLEVETLKRLEHPNIIRFYDSWTSESDKSASLTVNFITEMCGFNLRECVPRAARRKTGVGSACVPRVSHAFGAVPPPGTPSGTRRWTCAPSRTGAARFSGASRTCTTSCRRQSSTETSSWTTSSSTATPATSRSATWAWRAPWARTRWRTPASVRAPRAGGPKSVGTLAFAARRAAAPPRPRRR